MSESKAIQFRALEIVDEASRGSRMMWKHKHPKSTAAGAKRTSAAKGDPVSDGEGKSRRPTLYSESMIEASPSVSHQQSAIASLAVVGVLPRTRMVWDWNDDAAGAVHEMWGLMKATFGLPRGCLFEVVQGRATFFSRNLFVAMLCLRRRDSTHGGC
jgi:hypothetical protein